jgi:hypothetical protein
LALAALLLAAALQAPPAAADDTPVVVHLADGTSLPLRGWTFSYEYATRAGAAAAPQETIARRQTRELWLGKKRLDPAGLTVEIEYRMLANDPGEGAIGPAEIPVASRLRLVKADGRGDEVKLEPPHRDLLRADAKGASVVARSLDLHGTTFTGTRRELCVLSYTMMVQCGVERGGRVVKLEFPPAP